MNIVKGKDLGWKSYNLYLIPELAEKNVVRTTSSGVQPGLWYRPSFECKLDRGAKESTACIIEGYQQYQHTGEVILTLAFDIPILGTEQLYNLRKITIDRMFRNQQQAEQIIVPKFSESKSSIDQEIDESSAPSTHNYEVAQKEDETKISTIKTEPVADNTPIPFQLVEEKPSFQGGDINQFLKWVRENQIYPEIAKENGIQGRVTVRATINTDGSLTDIMVVRGVDPSLDKEAIRVVSQSPKWKPGKQGGKAVPVTYNFPVTF